MAIQIKRNFLLFLSFTCCLFFIQAQTINIQLCPLTHQDLQASLICVSKADGTSLFEHVLSEADIVNGSEYSVSMDEPGPYCFSIINEYRVDSINSGDPYYLARTYYNHNGDLRILQYNHPDPLTSSKDHMSSITINNAPVIEHWEHQSEASISNFRQTGNVVKAQANFEYDEDVFIVIKGEHDDYHRYVYIENDQAPIMGSRIPIKSKTFDYNSLPTDLSHYSIKLPFESNFNGFIKAKNESTGKYCVFFSGAKMINSILKEGMNEKYGTRPPKIQPEEGTLDLFVPDIPLSDFKASVIWGNWRDGFSYHYRINHGSNLKFPYIVETNFLPEYLEYDTLGVRTKMNPFPDNFRIYFTRKIKDGMTTYGQTFTNKFTSYWIVNGKNTGDIQFNLPMLSEENRTKFPASGQWRYEHFENVEFLEKDSNIDWINFFGDYNSLNVGYRDPFK